jgi:fatty-acid desaturase
MQNVFVLRVLQHINFWGFFVGLVYLFYLNQWYYYLATVIAVILISKVGSSIGQHRYFSHRSFTTTAFKEKIIAWLATLSTTGTILQFSSVHRQHHAHSDTSKDPHSPYRIGWYRSWFHWFDKESSSDVDLRHIKDLLKKPHVRWLHDHYLLILVGYWAILLLIDPWLLVFCYVVPAGYVWFNSAITTTVSHIKEHGYRNFETDDYTNNSHFWNWITLGEGYHNNHHHRQHEYNFAFTKKPGEWDLNAFLIERFLIDESHNKKTAGI